MEQKDKGCAYCGGESYYAPGTPRPNPYCNCSYRYLKFGKGGFETFTTSRHHTVASMREHLEESLSAMAQDAPVVFKLSVTRLDMDKIAKADAKRGAK